MPSTPHNTLLELFRSRTTLAPEILTDVFGARLPKYSRATTSEADFTQTVPAEYRADLLTLLENERPVYAIVIEAQLSKKLRKRFTWPLYVAAARDRHQCPAAVLVVTPSEAVARWAQKPIDLGIGSSFQPLVLGPSAVPRIVTAGDAAAAPELAILSALAHGPKEKNVVVAAFAGLDAMPSEDIQLYFDLIWSRLDSALRQEVQAMLKAEKPFLSDFANNYFEKGRSEGLEKGRQDGERRVLRTMLAPEVRHALARRRRAPCRRNHRGHRSMDRAHSHRHLTRRRVSRRIGPPHRQEGHTS